ncbi:MAG: hypothetical protein ABFR36_01865 [Acidobacteriota bacterium]
MEESIKPGELYEKLIVLFFSGPGENGLLSRSFRINGKVIKVVSDSRSKGLELTRALDHLSIRDSETHDLKIFSFTGGDTNLPLPIMNKAGDTGRDIPFIDRDGIMMSLWRESGSLSVLNRKKNIGIFFSAEPEKLEYFEKASPFRNIFQWWFDSESTAMIHSGAVGVSGEGMLISGRGGAGKTSTVISCIMNGMEYLGDDYVLISGAERFDAFSLFRSGKLTNFILNLYPELKERITNPCFSNEEKGLVFFGEGNGQATSNKAEIKGIIIPEIVRQEKSSFQPASASEAFRALAPSTVFQHIGNRNNLFRLTGRLTKDIPCYKLYTGSDPVHLAETVKEIFKV